MITVTAMAIATAMVAAALRAADLLLTQRFRGQPICWVGEHAVAAERGHGRCSGGRRMREEEEEVDDEWPPAVRRCGH